MLELLWRSLYDELLRVVESYQLQQRQGQVGGKQEKEVRSNLVW